MSATKRAAPRIGEERVSYEVPVTLTDPAKDVVAGAKARWVIGQ